MQRLCPPTTALTNTRTHATKYYNLSIPPTEADATPLRQTRLNLDSSRLSSEIFHLDTDGSCPSLLS
jgi:hypothetical protein